jgi:hypothetical protein
MIPAAEHSLLHRQAESARLNVRLRREVQRWRQAGHDPHDAFRGLRTSDEEALHDRPFAASWGQTVPLDPAAEAFAAQEAAAERQAAALAKQASAAGQPTCLQHLAATLGLDGFALNALLICLAPTLHLRYERLHGYLQDDVTRRRPTVNLILVLLCDPGPQRLARLEAIADDAPRLAHHNIIFSAAYLARADGGQAPLAHLRHGARRALQKMGRLLKEKEHIYG